MPSLDIAAGRSREEFKQLIGYIQFPLISKRLPLLYRQGSRLIAIQKLVECSSLALSEGPSEDHHVYRVFCIQGS